RWQRDVGGVKWVELLVLSNSTDPDMLDLRENVRSLGGTVVVRHSVVRALTIRMPAAQVLNLAWRADVVSISSNRAVQSADSRLEAVTGTSGSVRTYNTANSSYVGFDG